jgi:hypothetical protein
VVLCRGAHDSAGDLFIDEIPTALENGTLEERDENNHKLALLTVNEREVTL